MAGEAIRKDRNMDNLNYVSKKLIAEYRAKENTDFKVIETAYIQGNNKYIIEYDGGKASMYSVAKTFFEYEPRSGCYTLSQKEFKLWKKIREECYRNNVGMFKNFEVNEEDLLEIDLKDYITKDSINEHNKIIKSMKDNNLPF